MSITRRLRRLERGSSAKCPTCGQPVSEEQAEEIQQRQATAALGAKQGLIEMVEAMAARQREAHERLAREQAEGRGHFHDQGDYRGGQIASAPVQEVEGADVREHHERCEQGGRDDRDRREQQLDEQDSYDRELEDRVAARVNDQNDPVLKILRERRERRRQERERARRAVRPTMVNNTEGGSDD